MVSSTHIFVAAFVLVLSMVSLASFYRGYATLAALTPIVLGHYIKQYGAIPSLAEATVEEISAGLASKQFTSVDLVNVCASPLDSRHLN